MKMPKSVVLLSFVFGLTCLSRTTAQVDITLHPVNLLVKDLAIGLDFVIDPAFSIEGGFGYGKRMDDAYIWHPVQLTATGKYYFEPKTSADGFYADVFLRYVSRNHQENNGSGFEEYTDERAGLGVGVGYKLITQDGLLLEIGLGVGRSFYYTGEKRYVSWPNMLVVPKLAVGYRFGGK